MYLRAKQNSNQPVFQRQLGRAAGPTDSQHPGHQLTEGELQGQPWRRWQAACHGGWAPTAEVGGLASGLSSAINSPGCLQAVLSLLWASFPPLSNEVLDSVPICKIPATSFALEYHDSE